MLRSIHRWVRSVVGFSWKVKDRAVSTVKDKGLVNFESLFARTLVTSTCLGSRYGLTLV